ncbi:MFS transporter [Paenibacillus massiliensis]|uniref:MFS transporter n=1 Tax=Paenibacillus massiliensis TaxID=225917 RepID=UPI00039D608A|nr:MFS transporter [Paenibacillus massiliensis]
MSTSNARSRLALLALAVSAFAIGTTEFISVGLLPLIANDLHISVTTAGLTVTLYALGVMLGAPILTSLTSGVRRKHLLIGIMLVFILGNSLAAAAQGIVLLLVARVLSALAHGLFMSIGSTIAAELVPANRRASAIAIMFSGLTVATITGVPLGTMIGQQWGWRVAFIVIVIIGILSLLANQLLVPTDLRGGSLASIRDRIKLLTNHRLLLAFAMTALGYGGTFAVFTYLAPLLQNISGYHESTVAVILLIYGLAIALGNIIGGRVANQKPLRALLFMFIAQSVVLFILGWTAADSVLGLITVLLMGLLAFMNVPGLQIYVVTLAERYAPTAVDFASALNIAAFNAGIALGAFIGGQVTASIGLIHTTWVGGLMVALAALLVVWSYRLQRHETTATAHANTVRSHI